ncbi:heme biosynthesis protein [Ignicoccus islandicus DSM 13165]|uniref:Heme biosynthesis protein n=1 Tax=Ignicoccus islandicus DSM 13165 TaxID=940295 RepID=A0A0U2WKR9_9CREN|nr:radical SAM protein [Ignicoccus islandicus]ALU11537.1 heme biosynthesis protein [Ignicoccus islandicus DSM 13165]
MGMNGILTGIRMAFNNPIMKKILSDVVREVECNYNGEKVRMKVSDYVMLKYAGEKVNCGIREEIVYKTLAGVFDLSLRIFKGNREEVVEAFRDPAVRRGLTLVFEGLAKYGVTVPQRLPAPFLIVWNFTNMCNLRCKHCYQRADKPLPDELTLEEKLAVVEDLDRAGVAAVALSGGEPTIHPHFFRIVEELSSRGIYVAVATNGWLFSEKKYLAKAKEKGVRYVEVSVDSADPRKHDDFRGVPGSWKKAVQALRNAVELKVNHAMAVTITRNNLDEVDDILNLAEELGIWRVVFFNFVPVGRGKEIIDLDLTPEEREGFMRKIAKEMVRRKLEIYTTAPQYSRVTMEVLGITTPTHFSAPINSGYNKLVSALAEFIGGCGAGRIYAALEPNGDVTPCVFLPIVVGNVRRKSFREIWETSDLFLKLRDRSNLAENCKSCPYREVCGGCRARAYAYFNDPLGPDPGCIINKKWFESLKREAAIAQ